MVLVADVKAVAREPLDLLPQGQPWLRVLDQEDPHQKKINPRLAATG